MHYHKKQHLIYNDIDTYNSMIRLIMHDMDIKCPLILGMISPVRLGDQSHNFSPTRQVFRAAIGCHSI